MDAGSLVARGSVSVKEGVVGPFLRRRSGLIDSLEARGDFVTNGTVGVLHGVDVCVEAAGLAFPGGLELEAHRCEDPGLVMWELGPVLGVRAETHL
jgi:hypothetical protein